MSARAKNQMTSSAAKLRVDSTIHPSEASGGEEIH
jgi:hypothetical protein